MKVGTVFEIAYAHRLLNYDGKCARLHGHNGKVELEVEGRVNPETGMLIDFVLLKERVVNPLMEVFDHVTILQEGDPLLELLPGPVIDLETPPTAETLAQIFLQELIGNLKHIKGIRIENSKVRFWETSNCYAEASS